jgi:phage-related protein
MAETFTYQPTKDSARSMAPRVKQIAFGNGYKQIYGDGINANLESWELTFKAAAAEAVAIDSFFDSHGGYTPFNWTAPESGAVLKQYLCPSWRKAPAAEGGGWFIVTATFEEWAVLV